MMSSGFRVLASLAVAMLLASCTTVVSKQMQSGNAEGKPKKIAVFFDGTHNDVEADTNIKRLHSLVSLQNRDDLATIYIEGVGVGRDIAGMALGLGLGVRVRLAYQFLLEQYRPGDEIYIFGFSRGAFSARVLASLLYYAGLPANKPDASPRLSSAEIAELVYRRVKYEPESGELPVQRIAKTRVWLTNLDRVAPVSIEVLGLWDTVEAMGIPDEYHRLKDKLHLEPFFVDVDERNTRYGDQLCNVIRAYQALSIDDDREWIFTPLLLTRKHLFNACTDGERAQKSVANNHGVYQARELQDVWFAGAHSDVGGGAADSLLSGVSLNWMIEQLRTAGTGLLPDKASVPQDPFGKSHDPEAGLFSPVYHARTRNIAGYLTDTGRQLAAYQGLMCVHPSVFLRRQVVPLDDNENKQLELKKPCKVHLARDDSEGHTNPQRLKQVEPPRCMADGEASEAGQLTLTVQQWPNCPGNN